MSALPGTWFAVIDAAQDARLFDLVQTCADKACLFKGNLDPVLERAAPWLVRIDPREQLLPVWQEHGRGRSWGIMAYCALPLEDLRTCLRRFLQARLPDGKIALFRFYDPRVFATYLRAASPDERVAWFETVQQYAVEDGQSPALHQFRMVDGRLHDGDVPVD